MARRLFLFLIAWSWATAAAGQSAFTFARFDIAVPAQPGRFAIPVDINDNGVVVTSTQSSFGDWAAIVVKPVTRKRPLSATTFRCAPMADVNASTEALAVNNKGDVAGYCTRSGSDNIHGFIYKKNGKVKLLDVPGADHTLVYGISGTRTAVGSYYNPLEPNQSGLARIHGFKWEDGTFETIDVPFQDTYTVLSSVNKHGEVIGEYYRYVPATNETLEHHWFIYSGGEFTFPFAPSLDWMGGPSLYLADINDAGEIVGQRFNGGSGWDGLFFFADGQSIDIPLPPEYVYADVRGMNNKGQFVGLSVIETGPDPAHPGSMLRELHGYIATPVTSERREELSLEVLPASEPTRVSGSE